MRPRQRAKGVHPIQRVTHGRVSAALRGTSLLRHLCHLYLSVRRSTRGRMADGCSTTGAMNRYPLVGYRFDVAGTRRIPERPPQLAHGMGKIVLGDEGFRPDELE